MVNAVGHRFNKELGTGCAAKTSKSFSLPKSRPERSSNSDNVIWSTEKRPGSCAVIVMMLSGRICSNVTLRAV